MGKRAKAAQSCSVKTANGIAFRRFDAAPTRPPSLRCAPLQAATLPHRAGLSHLSHQLEKIGVVPGGAHHLSADRILFTVCAQSIAADSANQGKIFRTVILAGTALILLEDHVEAPVKSILDVPVTAHHIEDIPGAHATREDIEPSLLLALVLDDAHALHLRDCDETWKGMQLGEPGCCDDARATSLFATMRSFF